MSDNNITQDQLEPNVMEELESGIGDLSTLSTENKDSLVAAVTEIYGKNVIAEAIGEPLAVTDTFSEMGSEINSLLSSFKTNMMNSGVVVESGDKFKQLIEKIKGLTEGEGNKGVQYAEGVSEKHLLNDNPNTPETISVEMVGGSSSTYPYITIDNLNFTPSIVIAMGESPGSVNTTDPAISVLSYDYFSNTQTVKISTYSTSTTSSTTSNIIANDSIIFDNMIKLPIFNGNISTYHWYAIGVGEEDTTLRDSLASILEEEGVEVSEEDDMASLISKVDEEFDNKNITDFSMGTQKLNWTVYSNEWIELSLNHSCGKIPKLVSIGFFDYETELSNKYHTDENNYAVHKPTGLTNIYHFYISSITNDTIFLKMRYSNFNAGSSSHGVTAHYVLVY